MATRAAAAPRKKTKSSKKAKSKAEPKPKALEYNILLTATLCLLAFGAVMVYSASSAKGALEANDAGTTFLVRYPINGGIARAAMTVISRRGLVALAKVTAPLL